MRDTLVVVASNNGKEHLESFLAANDGRYPVLIVDTGTTDSDCLDYLRAIDNPRVSVTRTPYRGYDSGAYLWSFWHYPARFYLFLHDSLIPTQPDYVQPFIDRMPPLGAVAWTNFNYGDWDSPEQRNAIEYMFPVGELGPPPCGIFGPIFLTNHLTLEHLSLRGLMPTIPTHKDMAQGMERGWAICFHRAGLPVCVIRPGHDRAAMQAGQYPVFTKRLPNRR